MYIDRDRYAYGYISTSTVWLAASMFFWFLALAVGFVVGVVCLI